ncbi:hypothetical protein GLOIN_2v1775980 [Rhizophagus irregularis DAOM 181602=DAOM 197198]|uniref:Uncharacterized protein n=1 Tax=Rhizophagus irregularis (strain DAOM 181602 / DAOM 197198 / MUCL 43194) TaxID=747089 RepID=A0A2P4PY96_RHIID|nr:hypothetical protein GLOIN_2v1775980 [Rhizophagus irregularis DAOM 181602=DAOM 197198]POG70362.1 hypothetical protein GLOIN_2v1775980 [Rhizophagus irregularis DAOM 181602=DAOM 197198]CAG8567580.1 8147_t:CDS:2 [Rhizophagus irregularis]|eukprot:XP_025177228.1 hypothetical protein GLOIN_2v1775980 [Rhizophagus irregularis DAOM 181602=DAOM 197198]
METQWRLSYGKINLLSANTFGHSPASSRCLSSRYEKNFPGRAVPRHTPDMPRLVVFEVETADNLGCLVEKIKQVFSCSEAKDIELWKVEIPDDHKDEFLDLVLNDNDKLTEGELNRYWTEQPPKNHEKVDRYLQKVCSAGVIKIGDELRINKSYSSIVDGKKDSVPVYIGCKITEIINGKLTVILIDYDEEQKEIFSLNMLEEWLLVKFGLDKEYRPRDCHDCNEKIKIKREGEH